MSDRPATSAARLQGPVRLSMPASVAYDLGAFQKSLANLAERLGHPTCFSGADCTLQLERNFVINEKLELSAAHSDPMPIVTGPSPEPWRVTATLPSSASYNIKQVQEVAARIAGRLGCGACCSGFDIQFRHEIDHIVDQNLNVRVVGAGF